MIVLKKNLVIEKINLWKKSLIRINEINAWRKIDKSQRKNRARFIKKERSIILL